MTQNVDLVDASVIQFANEFYGKIVTAQKGKLENLFISPVSLYASLGMVLAGTDSNTRSELLRALKVSPKLKDAVVSSTIGSTLMAYLEGQSVVQLKLTNKMFIDKKITLKDDFTKELKTHFKSDTELLDFQGGTEAARKHINDSVAKATGDMIKELLSKDAVTKDTIVSLVNALYFKGPWACPFPKEQTKEGEFVLLTGDKIKHKMMFCNGEFPMADITAMASQAVKIPFKDTKWEMLIVLPNDPKGLTALTDNLRKPGKLDALLKSKFQKTKMDLTLPRFKLSETQAVDGKKVLQDMGVKELFSNTAKLSKISTVTPLIISSVCHKAVLQVDEEGATAAAATGAQVAAMSLPLQFKVDHPFFITILMNEKVPVFLGNVLKPEAL